MSVNDPIADMLTRIRNANENYRERVEMPVSSVKVEIARLLKEEGYISDYAVQRGDSFDTIAIDLKYGDDKQKVITGLRRISKPGRRVYTRKDRIPRVLGGLGTVVLSTPRGVMTGRDAEKQGIGGEVMCFVW